MNGIRSNLEQENYDVCSVNSDMQEDTPSGVISFSSESESSDSSSPSAHPDSANENDNRENNKSNDISNSNDTDSKNISSTQIDNDNDIKEHKNEEKLKEWPTPKEMKDRDTNFIVCEVDEESPARISITDTNIYWLKDALDKFKNSRCQYLQITVSDPSAKPIKGTNKKVNLSEMNFLDKPRTYILEQPDSSPFDRISTVLKKYESKLKKREPNNIATTTIRETNGNETIKRYKTALLDIYDKLSYYLSEELVILILSGLIVAFLYFVLVPIYESLFWRSSDISYYKNIKLLNKDTTKKLLNNNEIPKGKFIVDFDNMVAIPYHGNLIGYNYEHVKARTINLFDKSFKLISRNYDSTLDRTKNIFKHIMSKNSFGQIILDKEQKISKRIIKLIQHAFND